MPENHDDELLCDDVHDLPSRALGVGQQSYPPSFGCPHKVPCLHLVFNFLLLYGYMRASPPLLDRGRRHVPFKYNLTSISSYVRLGTLGAFVPCYICSFMRLGFILARNYTDVRMQGAHWVYSL